MKGLFHMCAHYPFFPIVSSRVGCHKTMSRLPWAIQLSMLVIYVFNIDLFLSSVQFSCSVVSDSLRPHEFQHARPPCPSPTPRVHSNSHPSSQWCHPAISSPVTPFSFCPQSLPASVFSNESTLRMRWPKYWSFSFSIIPSKEIPGPKGATAVSCVCSWWEHTWTG